jgi:hypothetical protein
MKRAVADRLIILLLVALALIQIGVLWYRGRGDSPPPSFVQVGDDLSGVSTFDSQGRERFLDSGESTILLVFRSDCVPCGTVASTWRHWLQTHGSAYRTVALSAEAPEPAREFASAHGLDVEVRTVEAVRFGGREHALTSRTPWVFVLDGSGVVLAEGHGSRIAEVAVSAEMALANGGGP